MLIEPDIPLPSDSPTDDVALLDRLRNGDEAAFTQLVETYQGTLIRIAGPYVADAATTGEVVQETWLVLPC